MKKKGITLDFTSLLDVIMIILFVVLFNIGTKTNDLSNEVQNLKNENEILKEKLNDFTDVDTSYRALAGESVIISVSNQIKNSSHYIKVIVDDDLANSSEFLLKENNMQSVSNSIEKYLNNTYSSNSDKIIYVVFNVDKNKIYGEEYDKVMKILNNFSSENNNVYFKEETK